MIQLSPSLLHQRVRIRGEETGVPFTDYLFAVTHQPFLRIANMYGIWICLWLEDFPMKAGRYFVVLSGVVKNIPEDSRLIIQNLGMPESAGHKNQKCH